MKSEFEIAITQLSADRNLAPEVILEAIEAALVSAYKRNYGANQSVSVSLDSRTGQARVYVKRLVTDQVADDTSEISLAEARTYNPGATLGDLIDVEVKPKNFGRIAAQTAKQVITQRIREAERDSVYLEYSDRAGELINAIVRNVDSRTRNVVLNLGKAEALLPRSEQIPGEHYRFNQRLRVYIVSVERTGHGPQITASRTHRDLLRRLLELEVPEIHTGTVEVKSIAREPGSRSKVAVAALQAGVDPVGSCVGMRGVRIQNIVNELNGEKIDVVEWSPDLRTFIANALSPAKVLSVYLNEPENTAKVVVPDRALSLAIGKEGQNARLAAKLTGWRIDIMSETEATAEAERLREEMAAAEQRARELAEARRAAAELLAQAEALIASEEEPVAEGEPIEPAEVAEPELAEKPELAEPVLEAALAPQSETEDTPLTETPSAVEAEPLMAEEVSAPAEELPQPEVAAPVIEAEAPAPLTETPEAGAAEVSPAEEEREEWVEGEAEEDEESAEERRRKGRDRERGRQLEFDERLGRLVARKRRKPGRRRSDWEESWGED
ncbi:MAG: transcription termination/antitermination protein NusA [Chloroflexi bacterium]|nr:transcription termination/antitermination protein NusA [Chloroflexota bacterium]